jgi:hypothetical protein
MRDCYNGKQESDLRQVACVAARWRLLRLVGGKRPVTGAFLGQPRLVAPALECFHLILGSDYVFSSIA